MSRYDVIIVGAGHNGLAAAARLGGAGRKVLLLERTNQVGGLAASRPFYKDYYSGGILHDTALLRPEVVRELKLESHGLKFSSKASGELVPGPSQGLLLSSDVDSTAAEIEAISPGDGKSFKEWNAFLKRIAPVMRDLLLGLPDRVQGLSIGELVGLAKKGWGMRKLGKADMLEIMRINLMCTADWLNEWFSNELLKAAIAAPAHYGTFTGPWSPGTTINLLLRLCNQGLPVEGGAAALVDALEKATKSAGVEIRTEAEVSQLNLSKGKISGVTLASGETLEANTVMAACHPTHTFFDLIPPTHLPFPIEEAMHQYRSRGTSAVVNLALSKPLSFACRPDADVAKARLVSTLDDLERSFDPVKYRELGESPVLEVRRPCVANESAAPSGGDVASILVHFVPYNLEGGWTDEASEKLAQIAINRLEQDAPGTKASIVGKQVITPLNLEQDYRLSGGHIHHGEHALDQLMVRPILPCTDYNTPIEGLYLCSSGSRPGGGLTGMPGLLGANKVLG